MTRLAAAVDLAPIGALAVDGTSGTLVAVDELGRPVAAGSLYNDRADDAAIAAVGRVAPSRAAVHGATSPLARAARLQRTRRALQESSTRPTGSRASFLDGSISVMKATH